MEHLQGNTCGGTHTSTSFPRLIPVFLQFENGDAQCRCTCLKNVGLGVDFIFYKHCTKNEVSH